MRILHISDIHWRGIARHKEYTKAFEKLFNDAKNIIKPDVIVNTGDTFHTKTQGITPEYIERMSWMLRCMGDIAPTYTLLGNHDGNLTNLTRQDAITPSTTQSITQKHTCSQQKLFVFSTPMNL